jgi:hypothetical protein
MGKHQLNPMLFFYPSPLMENSSTECLYWVTPKVTLQMPLWQQAYKSVDIEQHIL